MAIGIGTVPLISKASGTTYEIVLSNILLIPEFRISLIVTTALFLFLHRSPDNSLPSLDSLLTVLPERLTPKRDFLYFTSHMALLSCFHPRTSSYFMRS